LLALCGAAFATTYWISTANRRLLIAITVAIAALQIVPTTRALALDFAPDYERNSLEWDSSLIRFPIRSLIARLPDSSVSRIHVVDFGTDLISLKVAYPDLARRYDLHGDTQSLTAPDCSCRSASAATLAVFEWPANFSDTPDGHGRFEMPQAACIAQQRATCATTALEQRADGAIIGAIGAGIR
jgi:hypothetical protein